MALWAPLLNLLSGNLNKKEREKAMYLIVALSNPEKIYEKTPHNIGWESLLYFLQKNNHSYDDFTSQKKLKADILKLKLAYLDEAILLARPQTYMNLSGEAVQALQAFYKIPTENIIVLHDEIAFDLGTVKLAKDRSDGGHNGIKSIIQYLKSKNFMRLRIGVKTDLAEKMSREKFVLHKFNKDEMTQRELSLKKAAEALELLLKFGLEEAQNRMH